MLVFHAVYWKIKLAFWTDHTWIWTQTVKNDVSQWKMKGSWFTTDGSNETYWRMSGSNLLLHPSRAWICTSPHLSVDGTLMITTILALKHSAVTVSQPAAVELCPVQAPAATPTTVKMMGPIGNGGAPLVQEAPLTPEHHWRHISTENFRKKLQYLETLLW